MLFYYPNAENIRLAWNFDFQQDGASSYTDVEVLQYFNIKFPQRWIVVRGHVALATKVTGLESIRHILCFHVKCNVFYFPIYPLSHLKYRTKKAIEGIDTESLEKVWKTRPNIDYITRVNGGDIEQEYM